MTNVLYSLHLKPVVLRVSVLILLAWPAFGSATQTAEIVQCGQWLSRTMSRAGTSWRQFRGELKEQGLKRLVLAPRLEGRKFNKLAAFMDPLLDLPLETISYSRWKWWSYEPLKRRLSIFTAGPVGILAWGLLIGAMDHKADQWALEGLEKSVSDDVNGAAYTSEYVLSGTVTPSQAVNIISASQANFAHNLQPLRARAAQFQQLNIWTPEQVRILNSVLDRIRQSYKPDQLSHRTQLAKALKSDPEFVQLIEALPKNSTFTSQLLLEPAVDLYGRPDAYWLSVFFEQFRRKGYSPGELKGLASLEKIYSFHHKDLSLATLSKLVAETLANRPLMRDKLNYALKLGLPLTSEFVYRSDIPIFSQAEEFTDINGTRQLKGELDRWKIILEDQRFSVMRDSWERGDISELNLLLQGEMQIRSFSQVYEIYHSEGDSLKLGTACKLMYGAGSDGPPNPLFVNLQSIGEKLNLRPQDQASVPGLQYKLAGIYYSTFISAAKVDDTAKFNSLVDRAREEERQSLVDVTQGLHSLPALPSCANLK